MKPLPILALLAAAGALLSACQTTETDRDLFLQADGDKDGRLSLAEVKAVGLPRLFGRFDRDGDGSVTLADIRSIEPDFDEKEFTSRDLNHDGHVTFAEYRQIAEHKTSLIGLFKTIDSNQDGFIDRKEAAAYTAALEESRS